MIQFKEGDASMFRIELPLYYVDDMDAALGFYRDALGGMQTFQFPAEGAPEHVELRIGEVVIGITRREAVREMALPAPTAGHPGELVVRCDSVDAAVEFLRERGVSVLMEPIDHVAGHRRAYVADPDGNWVALISH